ncbi:NADP-dependent oxidoreductase [Nocardioides sp.]|uniref:NADP-dependent oxidoreductase n=1 Tax=Nocardioides sp. TaxID=35761 RepID=UPI002726BACF|nr:NADP-dependent oxidoreductase [Nocardioides sp.]MDO9454819.1 NADP-dependent oxidoreductase [Nocardioides sp.]
MTTTTRQVQLTARPQGTPTPENFRTVEVDLPDLEAGQVLVRNTYLSVDPYMRGRMNDVKSYTPPFALDAPLEGGAVGVVEESSSDTVPVGATVLHMAGWREHAVLGEREARVVDVDTAPASAYLGALGMPGLTAWAGLTAIGQLHDGDTVFVSGAAGAVGSMVGQLAKKLGAAKVVGSAGSAEKVAWLVDELGYDAAFDYSQGPVARQLAPHAPVDVYFDNVGGDHLEAAILHMADYGRLALCGAIAGYDNPVPGPRNLMMAIAKRLTLRGFIVSDHGDLAGEFYRTVGPWLAGGEIRYRETVLDGLDRTVEGFLGLATGANTGKMLIRLG